MKLCDVLHVPNLACNLLPVSKIHKAGLEAGFSTDTNGKGVCLVRSSKEVILKAYDTSNGLFRTKFQFLSSQALGVGKTQVTGGVSDWGA